MLVSKQYYVYIMTNSRSTVLYVGVTNDLIRRVYEHKEKQLTDSPENTTSLNLYITRFLKAIENAILKGEADKGWL